MTSNGLDRFRGRALAVATLHGKERAIAPALIRELPIIGCEGIPGIDTDRFGAFSGEVRRELDPMETCIAKARHGAEVSRMDLVIASEGSFGPYPPAPFVPCDEEILVLYDARDERVFTHRHVSLEVVFGGQIVENVRDALAFAERMKFPEHHVVLRLCEQWRTGDTVFKGVEDRERLVTIVEELLRGSGSCWIETDLRAMANPTRMKAIAETASRFAEELARLCPVCGECWFRITGTKPGLPCALCNWPTESIRSIERSCWHCGHVQLGPRPDGKREEEPQFCGNCNP